MLNKRNPFHSSKAEKITSAVATGSREVLSKAASARKFGKDVLKGSNHGGSSRTDDTLMSSCMDADENEHDFRWSLNPGSKKIGSFEYDDNSGDDGDNDYEVEYNDHSDNDKSSEKSSLEMAIGGTSTHSNQSLGLGTISEDEADDGDEFATESVSSGKKKKKKSKSGSTQKRAADRSPKRKMNRPQSERKPGKSKSSADDETRRGGLSRSKSSQSERKVGEPPNRRGLSKSKSSQSERKMDGTLSSNDDLQIFTRRTIKKTKAKKLKKGRSKSPMRVDFTGQVASATDDEPSEEFGRVEGDTPSPKRAPKNEREANNSESNADPTTRANMIAEHVSLRSTANKLENIKLEEIQEQEPLEVKKPSALEAMLTSGSNTHILGEEDSFVQRSSGGGKGRMIANSRGSGAGQNSRTSFSKQLRTSIFSDTSSFVEEVASFDELQQQSLDDEKKRVATLLDELETYEKELSQEHAVLQLERESLEFALDKQTDKNQELETSVGEMKARIEELESALKSQEDDQMLLVENTILKNRLEQKEQSAMLGMTTMHSMHSSGYFSIDKEEEDSSMQRSMHTDGGSDEGYVKPSAKLQGELLQTRAKLAEKDRTIQAQAEEIKSLRRECEDYKDDEAREKMKSYIEGLEKEKKFFIAEISKLKEANEKAAMSSSMSQMPPSSFPRQSITSLGMTSLSEVSPGGYGALDEDMPSQEDSFSLGGSFQQSQNFSRRGSTATQDNTITRRQSANAWRSFSTRLFGGSEEAINEEPKVLNEADKMLDDLTKGM
ncbi:MAG: hypothetical protein SGBAC_005871 [Bacillariaceae sp.]